MQLKNAFPARKPSLTMIKYHDHADDYDHDVDDRNQSEVDHDVNVGNQHLAVLLFTVDVVGPK